MTDVNLQSTEINLESNDDDTFFSDQEKIEVEHVNFEYEQSSRIRGSNRKFTVFNDTHLYQTVKNKHRRKYKYRIDLAFLDPKPIRKRFVDWKWLYASGALFLLAAVLILNGTVNLSSIPLMGVFIVVIVVALMSLLAFFHQSYDAVFFRSQYGRVRLVELINNNPDKADFRKFITRFIVQINKSKTARKLKQDKFLARELQELRRLKNETVVANDDYEKAKTKIFQHKAFKAA